ncbi:Hypothetical predicted protein [Mytilus galloprovincialis]|uniref:Uncharacterized protein n=1 Tax=Mytilus galloprovincialis TaxID=29158 RepID=A0A8B6GNM9_MYTGA|nr:Hypothetical predicted protein [Mytilus galloprovincialis]
MNQEMKELSMDEDNAIFERNFSGFILSVLHSACSEMESDAMSVQQTIDTDTASEEERVAFFRDFRTKEFERLNATTTEQNAEAENTETASEDERVAFFRDFRTKEFERLTATMKEQVEKAEIQDVQAKPIIRIEEIIQNQALDTKETAIEEDRVAFFQSVRDAERKKLVEAFERETIWKEEREERREKKRQEQIRKMFQEFHTPAVSPLSASYEPGSSKEQYHLYPSSSNTEYNIMLKSSVSKLHERVKAFTEEQKDLQRKLELSHATNPRADTDENRENSHINIRTCSDAAILKTDRINDFKRAGSARSFVNRIFKRSKSTTADISTKPVDREELKLDLSLLNDNKEKDEDQPDTARTSNSEWYTLSDFEETPRPRLKPFFTPLKETHDTISKSTSHKVAESMNQFVLHELTKSDPTEIPVHTGSTGRFQRFRKWFKRLCCCCCRQNTEDRDTVCH